MSKIIHHGTSGRLSNRSARSVPRILVAAEARTDRGKLFQAP